MKPGVPEMLSPISALHGSFKISFMVSFHKHPYSSILDYVNIFFSPPLSFSIITTIISTTFTITEDGLQVYSTTQLSFLIKNLTIKQTF